MFNVVTHSWKPTRIRRVIEVLPTGSEAVQVATDDGRAFAKFLGAAEGPHMLACEWIGTHLAALLGLPVFDFVVLPHPGIPEIRLHSGGMAQPGPAWLTRRVSGVTWGGFEEDLNYLANPADLTKLVLLDQWTRNCDRYRPEPRRVNYNNVFLMREGAPEGRFILVAMDHTHILTCGRPLSRELARIDRIREETAYGVFPQFVAHLKRPDAVAAAAAMAAIPVAAIEAVVVGIPRDWQVGAPERAAVVEFLLQRRQWLEKEFVSRLFPQGELL